ncbi:hypothetical protein ACF0H5_009355 [Mactra antiquata]
MRILLIFAILCVAVLCQPPPPPPPPPARDTLKRFNQRTGKQHNIRYNNSVITRRPPGHRTRPKASKAVQAQVYPQVATKAPAALYAQVATQAPLVALYPQVPAQAPLYPQVPAAASPLMQPAATSAQFQTHCKNMCRFKRPEPPVCGIDRRTYTTDCEMDCNYSNKLCDGPCPCEYEHPKGSGCICIREMDMQCVYSGKTTKTVLNTCEARCEGTPILFEGDCSRKPMRAMEMLRVMQGRVPAATAG